MGPKKQARLPGIPAPPDLTQRPADLVADLLDGARWHAEEAGFDCEIGDLRLLLSAATAVLPPAAARAFLDDARVRDLILGVAEYAHLRHLYPDEPPS